MTQRQLEEDVEGNSCALITSKLYGSDVWRNDILIHLSPFEAIRLSFVCKKFKKSTPAILNSKLYALFILDCCKCGSQNSFHLCTEGGRSTIENQCYPVKPMGDRCVTAEFNVVKEIHFDIDSFEIAIEGVIQPFYLGNIDCFSNRFKVLNDTQNVNYGLYLSYQSTVVFFPSEIRSLSLVWERKCPTYENRIAFFNTVFNQINSTP